MVLEMLAVLVVKELELVVLMVELRRMLAVLAALVVHPGWQGERLAPQLVGEVRACQPAERQPGRLV